MPRKGKKRPRDAPEPAIRSHLWGAAPDPIDEEPAETDHRSRAETTGEAFEAHLLGMYARGALTASDLCQLAYLAVAAGARGPAARLAHAPGAASSGHYQRRVDLALGSGERPEHCHVHVPVHTKRGRQVKPILFAAPHECLAEEVGVEAASAAPDRVDEWTATFENHPAVAQARAEGVPVYPVALYLDGVRYSRAISAGRLRSFVGFSAYNLLTKKRHFLGFLLKHECCRCSCRGWCSLHPVMSYLAWSFHHAMLGTRPTRQYDGTPWPDGHVLGERAAASPRMSARFILCQIKGDWSEFCTLGFPNWQSHSAPCIFCATDRQNFFNFNGVSMRSCPWAEHGPTHYDEACTACEIPITIVEEQQRGLIMREGGLRYDKRGGGRGRCLARNVPSLGLRKGDRLDPSTELPDIAKFSTAELPLSVIFWRRHLNGTKCTDPVLKRNPLFGPMTGATPGATLHIDTLHTLYLGVALRYVSEVVWRTLRAAPWGEVPLEAAVQLLKADLFAWYDANRIDPSLRLGELSTKMLGSGSRPELKTKAAETGTLVPWAINLCAKFEFEGAQPLQAAGAAYVEYMQLLRESPASPSMATCQQLMHNCLRHLRLLAVAEVQYTPKHHLWVHLTRKIPEQGNPRGYSCFLDESLNATIASIVGAGRTPHLERRVFQRIALLPETDSASWFARLP